MCIGGPIIEEQIEDCSELKLQKPDRIQIGEDKGIEAYVTHWQELEKRDQVSKGRSKISKNATWPNMLRSCERKITTFRD